MDEVGHIARRSAALSVIDAALAKALGVSEVARIARAEVSLRQFLLDAWNARAKRAAEDAARVVSRGKGPVTDAEIRRAVAAVRRRMLPWAGEVGSRFVRDVERAYRLARVAGAKKATGVTRASLAYTTRHLGEFSEPPPGLFKVEKASPEDLALIGAFTVVDEAALEALGDHNLFWLGRHYEQNVSSTINRVARQEIVGAGRDRRAAGPIMREAMLDTLGVVQLPTGFRGTAAQYFEGLVANANTVARAQGQLRSFSLAGVTRYVIVNPLDRRTCPVCAHMNGKTFTVQQGRDLMDREVGLETPDDVRNVHPWLSLARLTDISPEAGRVGAADARSLADVGFQLPPFHFRCRCAVDMA